MATPPPELRTQRSLERIESPSSLSTGQLSPPIAERTGLPGQVTDPDPDATPSFSMSIILVGLLGGLSGVAFSSGSPWLISLWVAGALALVGRDILTSARGRTWRMQRVPSWKHGGDTMLPRVRFRGIVEDQRETVSVAGGREGVVFARTLFFQPTSRGRGGFYLREQVRGVPFRVNVGAWSFDVDPRSLVLVDVPPRLGLEPDELVALGAPTRGWLRRTVRQREIAIGDEVELVGYIYERVAVTGNASPARGTPVSRTLMPYPKQGVWIRRLSGSDSARRLPK